MQMSFDQILSRLAASRNCFWCGDRVLDAMLGDVAPRGSEASRRKRTRDHFISWSVGGRFTVCCCLACNELKSEMDPVVFRDKFRPNVSAPEFDVAYAVAMRQLRCPPHRRSSKAKRAKKLSPKMQKLVEYYDDVYVLGYSSKSLLDRALR